MTMRLARGSLVALVIAGCGGGSSTPDAAPPDAIVDAPPPPPWWEPRPGEARDWDVQLHAPFDTAAAHTMYMLDLWALVPAPTTIDYGDNDPVAVPAGALAGTIATLHARTPPAIVTCFVETGMLDLGAPDARKFPGYEASPPNNPTAPKAGSVIGWSLDGEPVTDRFLDLRAAARATWGPLMTKRIELAKTIGCDAVVGDHNDTAFAGGVTGNLAGFMYTLDDQNAWYREVATETHDRKMSAGMKDAAEAPNQADDLAPVFDWILIQRCAEYDDCDTARPFINLHKAVFAIDYDINQAAGTGIAPSIACPRQLAAMIADGLVKSDALDATVRTQCLP